MALIKFVGRSPDVDQALVFANCERLLGDADPYVQKGVGWMLKVLSQYELQAVHDFLHRHLEHLMTGKLTPGLAAASISSIINLT